MFTSSGWIMLPKQMLANGKGLNPRPRLRGADLPWLRGAQRLGNADGFPKRLPGCSVSRATLGLHSKLASWGLRRSCGLDLRGLGFPLRV